MEVRGVSQVRFRLELSQFLSLSVQVRVESLLSWPKKFCNKRQPFEKGTLFQKYLRKIDSMSGLPIIYIQMAVLKDEVLAQCVCDDLNAFMYLKWRYKVKIQIRAYFYVPLLCEWEF